MAQRLILLGPPGAGKGTQAIKVSEELGVPHISTGDMMRAAVASGSELGKKVKQFLDAGDLVPDEVILNVMEQRLQNPDCIPGFLLDGFPRTSAQAEGLGAILTKLGTALTAVVHMVVVDRVVVERILKRGLESGRSDDTAEVVQRRLDVYKAQTAPLIDFYAQAGLLREIEGTGEIEQVFERIIGVIGTA